MKQRVSMGCAIAYNPPLLFLDEPTVGLDPHVGIQLWDFFNTLTQSDRTILRTSHTMDDTAHCQRLAFFAAGKHYRSRFSR